MTDPQIVRIGLLGCGTVGAALAALIDEQGDAIAARTGIRLVITRVAVRDLTKTRSVAIDEVCFTTDSADLAADPEIDVVVEVMGGIDPARRLVLTALQSGKSVITANKALLAEAGAELFAAADAAGVDLLFEAAGAGGIPLVRPLRESLLGEPITRVLGIVNGTTNYILTRMTEAGAGYDEALAEAQSLGYAEADPAADVDGLDAASKCAILASIAFGADVTAADVATEGISRVTAADIAYASRHGHIIKLLAIAELLPRADDRGARDISVRVHPTLVPHTHPLASVRESFNAVFVEGAAVGELMFYGRGAGGGPTASAVLGDLIDASLNLRRGGHASIGVLAPATIRPAELLSSPFYIRLEVIDEPGVLASVAAVFGRHGVSISSMEQSGLGEGAELLFVTHAVRGDRVAATLRDFVDLPAVGEVGSVIRVLSDEI